MCVSGWTPRREMMTSSDYVVIMSRRRVTAELNRLASLPAEVFEEIMRYVLGVFTGRLQMIDPSYQPGWLSPFNFLLPFYNYYDGLPVP